MRSRIAPTLALVYLAACGDKDPSGGDDPSPPTLSLTTPEDGAEVWEGAAVELEAAVADADSELGDLSVTWSVDGDARCEGAPDADGRSVCAVVLESDAVVTAEVTDPDGLSARDSVSLTVLPNDPPAIALDQPTASGVYYHDRPVALVAQVSDTEDAATALRVTWSDGETALTPSGAEIDADGTYAASVDLGEGSHALTATVEDTLGKRATATVTVQVWGDNAPPSCTLSAPADGAAFALGDPVTLSGTCTDPETVAVELVGSVDSDRDGALSTAVVFSSSGAFAELYADLTAGTHVLTLAVTDGYGDTTEVSVTVEICDATWTEDADGDGFGRDGTEVVACEAPAGFVGTAGDCDDADAATWPGAAPLDSATACMTDGDGDGYGALLVVADATAGTDCDDAAASLNPGASEICDGIDNDCDGDIDDADSSVDPATQGTWYADTDGDGYGDAATSTVACDLPSGHVADATDCDDASAAVNPAATEVCDAADTDEDCDGAVDDDDASVDTATHATWYADSDGDGYGDVSASAAACDAPSGHVADATDCDDGAAGVNPGATEVCDAADTDEDCDGAADDADSSVDASTQIAWYADADSDGYGDPGAITAACEAPSGHVADATDCDDATPTAYPGATEVCDGVQSDCSDGTWTSDAGIVSFEDASGAWTDATSTWAAGGASSPVSLTLATAGTVHLCEGTWTATLEVLADVNLVGEATASAVVIDAASTGTVLTLATDGLDVGLTDLTLTGGAADTAAASSGAETAGGALRCEAISTLRLDGVTLRDNTAGMGGGLYAEGCTVELDTVGIEDNVVSAGGGGLAAVNAVLSGTEVVVDGNEATSGHGGGVYVDGGDLDLSDSTISSNILSDEFLYGAGLYAIDGDLALTDGAVTDNTAGDYSYGGGLAVDASTLALDGMDLGDNAVSTSSGHGGQAWVNDTDLTSTDCTFRDESAAGAAPLDRILRVSGGTWTSTRDHFFSDSGGSDRAVLIHDVEPAEITDCVFETTESLSHAFGVYYAEGVVFDGCTFDGGATANSTAIYATGTPSRPTDIEVIDCSFTDLGGGFRSGGSSDLDLSGSTFDNVRVAVDMTETSDLVSSGNTFDGSGCTYSECVGIELNTNTFSSAGDTFTDLVGEAIYVDRSTGTISGGSFSNVDASSGRGAAIWGNGYGAGSVTVTGSSFSGSTSYDSCWYLGSSTSDCDTWGTNASFSCGSAGCN